MKLFRSFLSWHRENIKYDGFWQFEFFSLSAMFVLLFNILTLSSDPVDWMFLCLQLSFSITVCERWMGSKRFRNFADLVKEIMRNDEEDLQTKRHQLEVEHNRLVSANRRRKRTEKKLRRALLTIKHSKI